ncbi:MAG: MFS transporter [Deltaproteobacteria bacterium]|nr:MFS transporter [Deltaproteobacteria bacterium]
MDEDILLQKNTITIVMLTSFLTTFIGSSVTVALPSVGKEFTSSPFILSWMVNSYLLSSAVFLLPMGRIADITGRKKIFLAGSILFAFFTTLCGMSWSNGSMILFRLFQGMAASMIYATGMALLTSVIPSTRRGRAMGLAVTATYIGLSLGPVMGGIMCQYISWRSIFYFTGLGGVVVIALALSRLKGEWSGAEGESYDFIGSIFYISGIGTLLYGASMISKDPLAKYLLMVSVMLIISFILIQMKVRYPLFQVRIFYRNIAFAFSNLAAMISYGATFAIGFILSLYLQIIRGYSPQTTGFIILAQPIMMAAFSSLAGALSDRMEPRIVASWGMGLNTLGLVFFVFISATTPLWMIVFNLFIIGLGFALFSSPNTNAIMSSVEKRYYGIAASTVSTMRMIGMATSMALVTVSLSLFVGDNGLSVNHSAALLKSFRLTFFMSALLCFFGVFASLARGNVRDTIDVREYY